MEKNECRASGSRNRVARVGMAARNRPRGEGMPLDVLKKYGEISQKYKPSKMLQSSRAGSRQSSNRTICPACLHAAENGNEAATPFASCAAYTISNRIAAAVHTMPATRTSNSAPLGNQLWVRAENR